MALDFSDPSKLQTSDGREVRIYATDHNGHYPVVGAIRKDDGWWCTCWTAKGSILNDSYEHHHDLIPKPQRVTGWVNVYPNGTLSAVPLQDKSRVKAGAGVDCIGQIYIDAEVQT